MLLRRAGVSQDAAQAAVSYQKAADLGDLACECALVYFLVNGDPRAGVTKDAVRGFALLREAVERGYGAALYNMSVCYLNGEGVEKDVAHAVNLLVEAATQDDESTVMAQSALAACYMEGYGVEADTVLAALWCQRAADSGDAQAIQILSIIRTCTFCGTTPAGKHCERCRKVQYCNATCQAAHWDHETDPHKGTCRRAAEASQQEASERRVHVATVGIVPVSRSLNV